MMKNNSQLVAAFLPGLWTDFSRSSWLLILVEAFDFNWPTASQPLRWKDTVGGGCLKLA